MVYKKKEKQIILIEKFLFMTAAAKSVFLLDMTEDLFTENKSHSKV